MDINPFEFAGKTARRATETVDDLNQFLLNAVWDHTPAVLLGESKIAKKHSDSIREQIDHSLRHGDVTEAAHQMRREIYFCSTIDRLAGSKNELAARSGLKAVEEGLPPVAIGIRMDHATDNPVKNGFYTSEPDRIDVDLRNFRKWYEAQPLFALKEHLKLSAKVKHAESTGEPIKPQDIYSLAKFNFAFADLNLHFQDRIAANRYFADGLKYTKAAKEAGANITYLEEMSRRVGDRMR